MLLQFVPTQIVGDDVVRTGFYQARAFPWVDAVTLRLQCCQAHRYASDSSHRFQLRRPVAEAQHRRPLAFTPSDDQLRETPLGEGRVVPGGAVDTPIEEAGDVKKPGLF